MHDVLRHVRTVEEDVDAGSSRCITVRFAYVDSRHHSGLVCRHDEDTERSARFVIAFGAVHKRRRAPIPGGIGAVRPDRVCLDQLVFAAFASAASSAARVFGP